MKIIKYLKEKLRSIFYKKEVWKPLPMSKQFPNSYRLFVKAQEWEGEPEVEGEKSRVYWTPRWYRSSRIKVTSSEYVPNIKSKEDGTIQGKF